MAFQTLKVTHEFITQGNVRVGKYINGFIPKDTVGSANPKNGRGTNITLLLSGIDQEVKTDIPDDKKIFRLRTPIKEFVRHHNLFEGDKVCLEKINQRVFRLTPIPKHFTFIDLFSGIGGIRLGLERSGGTCLYSIEIDKHACEVYRANFQDDPYGDITKINPKNIPNHEVLAAGFPCQPFSISGQKMGFEDTRGTLIYHVFEILKEKQPEAVLLENVKFLIHHNQGNTLSTIIRGLNNLGYKNVSYSVLNAINFGVPQNRERIIIIAHKHSTFDFNSLKVTKSPPLKYFLDSKGAFERLEEPYTILKNCKKQESGLIFAGYRNKKTRTVGVRPNSEHLSRVHKQPNRIYSTEGVHPTIPSQEPSGRFWIYHAGEVRKLTLNECYRIMGFPKNFKRSPHIAEQYKQIGNSVCVPMFEELGRQIVDQLLREKHDKQ